MKITVSCKQVEFHPAVEAEIQKDLTKVDKLLTHYSPDLVHLHATFEKHPRKEEYSLSLNLALPTGTLHDVGEGSDVRGTIKKTFAALSAQLKKHLQKLRGERDWDQRLATLEPTEEKL
jgi:ribosome-associated translation inhibitor RaiA